jgi:glutamate transport system permease protein
MDAVIQQFPVLFAGFLKTLALLGIAGAGALVFGTLVAGFRVSPIPPLRAFAATFTELFRNIPLTLVLFGFANLGPYLGARSGYFVLAAIGLTLYTTPFIAEAIRSGINGIPVGQAEAARSIGLRFSQVLGHVILPQAGRMVVPPIINVLIALTKNTSVAGGFFVIELFASSRDAINARGDEVIPILLAVAAFYLLVTVSLGIIASQVEKRVAVAR